MPRTPPRAPIGGDAVLREPHLTARGRKLLFEVATHLEQYPDEFDMESWIYGLPTRDEDTPENKANLCATTCCIAGWVTLLANKVDRPLDLPPLVVNISTWSGNLLHADAERALTDALNLSGTIQHEAIQVLFRDGSGGQRLFHVSSWPYSYRKRYEAMGSDRHVAKAHLAAEYIRIYAETDGQLDNVLTEEELYGPDGEDDNTDGIEDEDDNEFFEPEEDGDDKDEDE